MTEKWTEVMQVAVGRMLQQRRLESHVRDKTKKLESLRKELRFAKRVVDEDACNEYSNVIEKLEMSEELFDIQPEVRSDFWSDWMFWAYIALKIVVVLQHKDGVKRLDAENQVHDNYPESQSVLNLLVQQGCVSVVEVPEDAYPYRITFRGSLLMSALEDIASLLDPDTLSKKSDEERAHIMQAVAEKAIRLLSAGVC